MRSSGDLRLSEECKKRLKRLEEVMGAAIRTMQKSDSPIISDEGWLALKETWSVAQQLDEECRSVLRSLEPRFHYLTGRETPESVYRKEDFLHFLYTAKLVLMRLT
jgi:hypothetical protein